jgi:hypothetical protein
VIETVPDPIAVLRAILLDRVVGTDLAGVAVRDAREEGDAPPYVVLNEGGDSRLRAGGALWPARVTLSVTAESKGQAAVLWRLASAALHRHGPERLTVDGDQVGVWRIFDETGLQGPVQEPDTSWWRAFGVFDVYMADRAIG